MQTANAWKWQSLTLVLILLATSITTAQQLPSNGFVPPTWSPVQEPGQKGASEENPGERENEDEFEEGDEGEENEIETDRDSFTPSTKIAGSGRLITEASYTFVNNRYGPETHSFPELLLRYGFCEKTELRLGWNYEVGGVNSILSGNSFTTPPVGSIESEDGSRILYGVKRFLTEQDGWRPESSLIVQGSTPTHGESNRTFFTLTPVAGWSFDNGAVWDFATRFSTLEFEDDHFNGWSPSTVIKFPISERSKSHIEFFGVYSDGREIETVQHFISPGIHYLLNKDLEIGWRMGWGLNDQSPNFFVNFGIGRQY